jgi:hypothetical protein
MKEGEWEIFKNHARRLEEEGPRLAIGLTLVEKTIIAAYRELKERREDESGLQSVCVECGPVTSCDEDGCCSSCGASVAVGWGVTELWEELAAKEAP